MLNIGFIGGADSIGKSLTYLEFNNEAIIVDAGMQFPDELESFGVSKIVPNGIFLRKNIKKIKGLFITHLHEDHIGGIKRFLEKFNVPVYADILTIDYIKTKNKINSEVTFIPIYNNQYVNFNYLQINPFKVEHSVLYAFGFDIHTPYGNIVISGDYKLGKNLTEIKTNLSKLHIKKKPFIFISESTNADEDGCTQGEEDILSNFQKVIKNTNGILVIATFASNMPRVKNIINLCEKLGRPVYIMGKSLEIAVNFLYTHSYISKNKINFISDDNKTAISKNAVILSTGCQGEKNAGLYKLINILKKNINKNVLFSSSIIPGNENSINEIKCELLRNNFKIIENENLYHVSGHAKKVEIKEFIKYLNPKYFIPVHGDYIKLINNRKNALECGVSKNNIIIPENDCLVKFKRNGFEKIILKDKNEYISNHGVEDDTLLNARKAMASNGIFFFLINKGELLVNAFGILPSCRIVQMLYRFKNKFIMKSKDKIITEKALKEEVEKYFSQEIKNNKMPYVKILKIS